MGSPNAREVPTTVLAGEFGAGISLKFKMKGVLIGYVTARLASAIKRGMECSRWIN
jgi:hypothetical protein